LTATPRESNIGVHQRTQSGPGEPNILLIAQQVWSFESDILHIRLSLPARAIVCSRRSFRAIIAVTLARDGHGFSPARTLRARGQCVPRGGHFVPHFIPVIVLNASAYFAVDIVFIVAVRQRRSTSARLTVPLASVLVFSRSAPQLKVDDLR